MTIEGTKVSRTFETDAGFNFTLSGTPVTYTNGHCYITLPIELTNTPSLEWSIWINDIKRYHIENGRISSSYDLGFDCNSDGTFTAKMHIELKKHIIYVGPVTVKSWDWDVSANCPAIDMSEPTYTLNYTLNSAGYIESLNFSVNHSLLDYGVVKIQKQNGYNHEASYNYDDHSSYYIGSSRKFWDSGKSYPATVKIVLDRINGTYEYSTKFDFPSYVDELQMNELEDMLINGTQKITYKFLPYDIACVNDFNNKTVKFYSSDTTVATVSTSGVITAKKAGSVNITVESQDATSGSKPRATQTVIITATAGFPSLSASYDTLDVTLVNKLLKAENMLKDKINPTSWITITFNQYSHNVFTIQQLLTDMFTNCKNLANKSNSSCKTKASGLAVTKKNTNANWQTNINSLVSCLKTMKSEQNL